MILSFEALICTIRVTETVDGNSANRNRMISDNMTMLPTTSFK
jgi:hypothetical protein